MIRRKFVTCVLALSIACAVPSAAAAQAKDSGVKVASPVKGIVTKVWVKAGDAVEAGQVLVSIDDRLAAKDIEIAEAGVDIAKADYQAAAAVTKEAEAQLQRALKLGKGISAEEVAVKKLMVERYTIETQVKSLMIKLATLELAKKRIFLDQHRIMAPASGKVFKVLVQPGEGIMELQGVIVLDVKPAPAAVPAPKQVQAEQDRAALQQRGRARGCQDVFKVPSPVGGIIDKVLTKEGEVVTKGQSLIALDDRHMKESLEAVQVKLAKAEDKLHAAKVAYGDAESAYRQQVEQAPGSPALLFSKIRIQLWMHVYQLRAFDIKLGQQELQRLQVQLELHQIVAPATGKILKIHHKAGQAVSALETVVEMTVDEQKN